jgi:predicted O-methyltransferase YrrM
VDRVEQYITTLFAPEDDLLRLLREEADRSGLPPIAISADTGRLLQVLIAAIRARRVLEVGTLGGYSAIWMARALPEGGELVTIESDPKCVTFAQRQLERAGVHDRVRIRAGRALEVLPSLDGEQFDLVFLDADKAPLPRYLEWALRLVRTGGIIAADNALWGGRVCDPAAEDEDTRGVREFNRRLAEDRRLRSILVPTHDGVAIAVVLP